MGGKPDAPSAPSYAPQQQASLQAFQSDQAAADNLYGLAGQQLSTQGDFARASGQVGQDMMTSMQDAQQWGRQQFNEIWPYAKDYLSSQQALSNLAGQNASDAVIAARENRAQAEETYRRYQNEFLPVEDRIVQNAMNYNTPARADQASGQAQAAVRTASDAAEARRQAELKSYDIDPSQARYQGEGAIANIASSAAQAGAGTASRLATEQEGNRQLLAAAQMGMQLPTQALNQLSAATQGANSALQAGQVGNQGLNAATGVFGAGTTAGGSPVAYGYMANPYTQLNATQAGLASNLYQYGTSALGNMTGVINASTGAQNSQFSNQISSFNAQSAQDQALWGGVGKALGGVGSFLTSPSSGTIGSAALTSLGFLGSDRRLKEDIKPLGQFGKLPMYSYRYRGSSAPQVGFMADEVEQIDPSAVITTPSGYKAVNYARATLSALGA